MAGTAIVLGTLSVILSNPGATAVIAGIYLVGAFVEKSKLVSKK